MASPKRGWDDTLLRRLLMSAMIDAHHYGLEPGGVTSVERTMTEAEAHTRLARALYKRGEFEKAEDLCRRAIGLDPAFAEAHVRLGKILLRSQRIATAFESFTAAAELTYAEALANASIEGPAAEIKARHDREQRDYLAGIGLREVAPTTFHIATGAGRRLAEEALNRANSPEAVSERWRQSSPQVVVIDDFLTPEALVNLRRFCSESTIWRTAYKRGYLEAFLRSGISCPLLAQIAEELRLTHPAVFGSHPLWLFWGFKYDSRLSGVPIHADSAAINVNFWITPDEANLDPGSGGLLVWDKPPPKGWTVDKFNSDDPAAAREFLESSGARSTKIPHRSNRAVIFDSSLFHATDDIHFREGYLDRRINLTLLYGRGGLAPAD